LVSKSLNSKIKIKLKKL
jgi:hypothetical protein